MQLDSHCRTRRIRFGCRPSQRVASCRQQALFAASWTSEALSCRGFSCKPERSDEGSRSFQGAGLDGLARERSRAPCCCWGRGPSGRKSLRRVRVGAGYHALRAVAGIDSPRSLQLRFRRRGSGPSGAGGLGLGCEGSGRRTGGAGFARGSRCHSSGSVGPGGGSQPPRTLETWELSRVEGRPRPNPLPPRQCSPA